MSILRLEEGQIVAAATNVVCQANVHPPSTPVFALLVEGEGSYIVEGYVSQHELPNILDPAWLWTNGIAYWVASSLKSELWRLLHSGDDLGYSRSNIPIL